MPDGLENTIFNDIQLQRINAGMIGFRIGNRSNGCPWRKSLVAVHCQKFFVKCYLVDFLAFGLCPFDDLCCNLSHHHAVCVVMGIGGLFVTIVFFCQLKLCSCARARFIRDDVGGGPVEIFS